MSEEVEAVLGYKPSEMDVSMLINKIHPDDQPWFLNIESKITEFLGGLTLDQIPNYKFRYDYRIQKKNGDYIRILQQTITLQYSEIGGIMKTFVVHTVISSLKKEGNPVVSFIGLNGEPSFIDIKIEKGANAKEIVLKHVLALEPKFKVEYTKHGNPVAGTYDRADSYVIAKAGYILCQNQKN